MINCQFIFKPGIYDADFHRLDDDMASVRALAEFPAHQEAKGQVERWYDGYQIVISEVTASYGDGRLPHVTAAAIN